MSAPDDMVDRCAFALFQSFIRNAVGTCRAKRDMMGNVMGLETPEEAAERRWRDMPELSRDRFRAEASAVLAAA